MESSMKIQNINSLGPLLKLPLHPLPDLKHMTKITHKLE